VDSGSAVALFVGHLPSVTGSLENMAAQHLDAMASFAAQRELIFIIRFLAKCMHTIIGGLLYTVRNSLSCDVRVLKYLGV
jgi:hypothetical protein